jgi:hypothetical protein
VSVTTRPRPKPTRGRNATRIAGAAGCLGAAATLAAHAASATFQGPATVAQQSPVTAGNLYLTVPSYPGAPATNNTAQANRMQLAVDGIYPNAVFERALDITVAGSIDLSSMTVEVVAASNSPLVTDGSGNLANDRLGMLVDMCSTDWTENLTDPSNPTYTCSGTRTQILGDDGTAPYTPVQFAKNGTSPTTWTLAGAGLTSGTVNHLRFRFKLPQTAPNSLQGLSTTVTFTFDGTQRAGTAM